MFQDLCRSVRSRNIFCNMAINEYIFMVIFSVSCRFVSCLSSEKLYKYQGCLSDRLPLLTLRTASQQRSSCAVVALSGSACLFFPGCPDAIAPGFYCKRDALHSLTGFALAPLAVCSGKTAQVAAASPGSLLRCLSHTSATKVQRKEYKTDAPTISESAPLLDHLCPPQQKHIYNSYI